MLEKAGIMMRSSTNSRGMGFTLVELLVVIAIILTLCGLLSTSLIRAKTAARSIKCKNNEHQIGIAMQSFLGDHSSYPSFKADNNDYFAPLFPYTGCVSTGALYHCPSFRKLLFINGRGGKPVYTNEAASVVGSYGWNRQGIASAGLMLMGLAGQEESRIKSPSNLIALGDAYLVSTLQHVTYGDFELGINRPTTNEDQYEYGQQFAGTRHGGYLNVLFADGHVENFRWRKLLLDRSDGALMKWNFDNEPHRDLLVKAK